MKTILKIPVICLTLKWSVCVNAKVVQAFLVGEIFHGSGPEVSSKQRSVFQNFLTIRVTILSLSKIAMSNSLATNHVGSLLSS